MPHLKFNRDDWDENGLYFVEFKHGNGFLKWYPKWEEVGNIFQHAWAWENIPRNPPTQGKRKARGKLVPYFHLICAEILLRSVLRHLNQELLFHGEDSTSPMRKFNDATEAFRQIALGG